MTPNSFRTINDRFTSPYMRLNIFNLEINPSHWKSVDKIIKIGQEVESLLLNKTFIDASNDIVRLCLRINKDNPRIQEIFFFTESDKLIIVCVSDVATFKPENFLKRRIEINLIKQDKYIEIIDITALEWHDRSKKLPVSWIHNEKISKLYSNLKKITII